MTVNLQAQLDLLIVVIQYIIEIINKYYYSKDIRFLSMDFITLVFNLP